MNIEIEETTCFDIIFEYFLLLGMFIGLIWGILMNNYILILLGFFCSISYILNMYFLQALENMDLYFFDLEKTILKEIRKLKGGKR